jgi:hypothetical protein
MTRILREFKKEISLVLLLVSIGACFMANPYYKVSKSGASAQQTSQDNFECQQLSQGYGTTGLASSGQGIVTGGAYIDRNLWRQCLHGKGYEVSSRGFSDHKDEEDRLKAERAWLNDRWQVQRGVNMEFDHRLDKYSADVADFRTWQP